MYGILVLGVELSADRQPCTAGAAVHDLVWAGWRHSISRLNFEELKIRIGELEVAEGIGRETIAKALLLQQQLDKETQKRVFAETMWQELETDLKKVTQDLELRDRMWRERDEEWKRRELAWQQREAEFRKERQNNFGVNKIYLILDF